MVLTALLLLVALAGVVALSVLDRAAYRRFKALTDTRARQRVFRRWIVASFVLFTGYTLLGLALLGRLDAVVELPVEFLPAWLWFGGSVPSSGGAADFILGGAIGGAIAIAVLIVLRRRRRTRAPVRERLAGDIAPLMPRNRAELAHAAVLSINAGLSEELFFRLLLPLLFASLIGNVWIAFALATLVFGLAHAYQGWVGVAATTVIGAALAIAYLVAGSLWPAIVAHAAIDLAALVVRPVLSGRIGRADAAA